MGCESAPNYSGSYILTVGRGSVRFELKPDGSFIGSPEGENDDAVGTWKVEGDLLVCEGTTTKDSDQLTIKFNKTTFELISLAENGEEVPLDRMIPDGADGIYLKKVETKRSSSARTESGPKPSINLIKAVSDGNVEVVKQWIDLGVNVNMGIRYAIGFGHLDVLELLIRAGADVNGKDEEGMTPLITAIDKGQKRIVEFLIAEGADVNLKEDMMGGTPIMWAVFEGEKEMVVLLIAKGAKVNARSGGGSVPDDENQLLGYAWGDAALHAAITKNSLEIVELLIANGADVNLKVRKGRGKGMTPMDLAIKHEHPEIESILREHGGKNLKLKSHAEKIEAALKHIQEGKGLTGEWEGYGSILHWASAKGHGEVVELLVAKQPDLNLKDADGKTALWSAVIEGQEAIVVRLVNGGAGVQSRDNKGNTLLHEALPRAFDEGHVKIVELCLAKGLDVNALNNDHSTPLHAAAWRGDGEFAELLLSKGADLNAKNKEGATPLAYAVQDTARNVVRANRNRTAQLLINAGADLDVGSNVKDGKTLLHWAAGKGFTKVIEALVAKGADVNARTESLSRTDQRKTPLHVAAYEGHAESVKVLVANGADVHAVDKGKNTPLLSATGNYREKPGKFEIVKLLVEKGANVNAVENCDRSALYNVANHNELEILEYLISKGADVNVRNRCSSGETPLHAAAKDGDMDVAKLLIASGADVNALTGTRVKRRDKKSPLHFASEKGQGDLAELLIKNGANVKMQDGNGDTVLHFAALKGDKAQMALFLDSGADVNAKNAEGMTPLHKAGRGGVRNTMEAGGILLQGGANINEVVQSGKYEGKTILDFVEFMYLSSSREDFRKSVVSYFRKHGGKTGEELKAEGK